MSCHETSAFHALSYSLLPPHPHPSITQDAAAAFWPQGTALRKHCRDQDTKNCLQKPPETERAAFPVLSLKVYCQKCGEPA